MASLNRVMILGRLGQDPELRYTQSQMAVATLSVATTESYGTGAERKETTEWHRVVVWGEIGRKRVEVSFKRSLGVCRRKTADKNLGG